MFPSLVQFKQGCKSIQKLDGRNEFLWTVSVLMKTNTNTFIKRAKKIIVISVNVYVYISENIYNINKVKLTIIRTENLVSTKVVFFFFFPKQHTLSHFLINILEVYWWSGYKYTQGNIIIMLKTAFWMVYLGPDLGQLCRIMLVLCLVCTLIFCVSELNSTSSSQHRMVGLVVPVLI